jgi:hypothetical protein
MNKEVSVTGMEVKAHSEEGLLINEVAAAGDHNWDELATGGWAANNAIELRPASTSNLTNWWHANSKKSNDEAGASGSSATVDTVNTVEFTSGSYYKNIGSGSGILNTTLQSGSGGSQAETIVYFDNASFGEHSGSYDNGEGYYVMYKYYLKSSKNNTGTYDIDVDDFLVKVTATKQNEENSGSDNNMALDKALRVGVMIDGHFQIFAPLYSDNQSYKVANGAASIGSTDVTAYGTSSSYVSIDTGSAKIALPNVVNDGMEVDVYVWFEGEDANCISDNLTAVLDTYQIDINFKDAGLNGY